MKLLYRSIYFGFGNLNLLITKKKKTPKIDDQHLISSKNSYGQRTPLFCIPIPAQNSWSKEVYPSNSQLQKEKQPKTVSSIRKRQQPEDHSDVSSIRKRQQPEDHSDNMAVEQEDNAEPIKENLKNTKFQNNTEKATDKTLFTTKKAQISEKFFPTKIHQGSPSIILVCFRILKKSILIFFRFQTQIYEEDTENFKVNQLYEFVGIFGDPFGCPSSDEEAELKSFPTSLVPRIHALFYRNLTSLDLVVPLPFLQETREGFLKPENRPELLELRKQLLMEMTETLNGDALLAEYLLASLVSTMYTLLFPQILSYHHSL